MRQALRYRKPDAGKPGGARLSLRDKLVHGGQRLRLVALAAIYGPYAALMFASEGLASPVPYLVGLGMCWLAANVLVDGLGRAVGTLFPKVADTPPK